MQKIKNNKKYSLSILTNAGVEAYQQKPGEKYMNETQIIHFKRILETWYNQIKNEINSTILYRQQKDTFNLPDPVDRAVQEEEFNFELRNRDREYKLIKKIETTLKKIENNNFGFCDFCGIEIGIKRLEAHPTANLCIDCKTLDEIRKKQIVI